MLILISPAKTFSSKGKFAERFPASSPRFLEEAHAIVGASLSLSQEELGHMFSLSPKLREEVYHTQRKFFDEGVKELQAPLNYSGMVYRKLSAIEMSPEEWAYAEDHLRMTSFVYGLLRPSDLIRPYRMEGTAHIPGIGEGRIFDFWRDRLTPLFIEEVKRQGGTLLYLASDEMRQLFHWAEVEKAVRVITPNFLVRQPDGRLKQIVIYTKMARGSMAGEVLRRRIETEEELRQLTPEGFVFAPEHSTEREWTFILG